MSFEIGRESLPNYARGTRRAVAGYPGLGDYGLGATAAATSPWMVGLPGPGDAKDKTRIAYAKRDHDLALSGNATAYANLRSQAVGSATRVGKAWYGAALADVNRSRIASSPTVTRPPAPVSPVTAAPRFVMPVLKAAPDLIVKQATDMGLKVQQTADGSVVAVNNAGAVVSKPLPVAPSMVTDNAVVPSDAVQANAPPPRVRSSSGILSILDKLSQQSPSAPSVTSSDSFIPSSGAPAPPSSPSVTTLDVSGNAVSDVGSLFKNPVVMLGVALGAALLFLPSNARRR